MQVLNGMVSRRSWLLALAALSALLAVAALTLTSARAQSALPDGLALTLSLEDDSDNTVPAGSPVTVNAALTYSGDDPVALEVRDITLRVSGSFEWETSGRSSLGGGEGELPDERFGTRMPDANLQEVACADRTLDETTTWTCTLNEMREAVTAVAADPNANPPVEAVEALDAIEPTDTTIEIPLGTADGAFTISGSLMVGLAGAADDDFTTLSDTLEVTIGTVDEVDSVTFGFAANPDDDNAPFPSTIEVEESTTLQLAVLNANATASAKGNIASVLFTTTSGTLRLVKPMGGCGGSGLACQVPVDALNATNSDDIQVSLAHPGSGQSGTATVSATVLSIAGASFMPDPIEIIFSGPPETLTISEPPTSLLNVQTANDDRDVMTLSVSAEDKSGNRADVPVTSRSATLKDPDGKTASGVSAAFTAELDANNNPQVEITVTAAAASALAAGDYTLEVRAGGKTATQTINVSAGAAAVSLSVDGAAEIGQRLTVTATVTDAAGALVADGTPVTFTDGSAQATPALVPVNAETKTTDGTASAAYLVVSSGTGFVTASSGDSASDVLLIRTAVPSAGPVSPAESLSSTAVNSYSVYTGAEAVTASELLAGLEGASGILRWDGSDWLRYNVADGREVPGSVDFAIPSGSILWLSG